MSSELAPATALTQAGAVITETSLRFENPESITWESYEELGQFLGTLGRAYPWWVGDFLNAGEDVFGEEFAQIEATLPHSPQTCSNYKSVAKHIPPSRRRSGLSYSVHAEVAYKQPRERDEILARAAREGWKREEMRAYLKDERALPDPVSQQAVTGSGEGVADPVPGPVICPSCGHRFDSQD